MTTGTATKQNNGSREKKPHLVTIKPLKPMRAGESRGPVFCTPTKDRFGKLFLENDDRYKAVGSKSLKQYITPRTKVVIDPSGRTFDLNEPKELAHFLVCFWHPYVARAKDKVTNETRFYVEDANLEAEVFNEISDWEYEGYGLIKKMPLSERGRNLRLFHPYRVETMSEDQIKAELVRRMKDDPAKFVAVVNDPDKELRIFIEELVSYKVVYHDQNGYKRDGALIATSKADFFDLLKKQENTDYVESLRDQLGRAKSVMA